MKKIIAVMLVFVMSLLLCACGGETASVESSNPATESNSESQATSESTESEEASTEANQATFKVTVVTSDGTPVPGVMVQLCKDTCIPAKTDDNGVATFNAEITDGYKLSVLSCPEGLSYEGDAEIYLESGITEYTLELTAGDEK